MNKKSFEELTNGYVNGQLSEEELAHFLQVLQKEENQDNFQNAIEQLLSTQTLSGEADQGRSDIIFQEMMENIEHKEKPEDDSVKHLKKRTMLFVLIKTAAAACVIGLLMLSTYLWFHKKEKRQIAKTEVNNRLNKKDVLPGGDKAILTLADGSTIVLDDAQNGALAQQGNTKVIKLNGKLDYNASSGSNQVLYNTISTPRGGKYQIELPDGSRVWLNAASSLRFPTAFIGKERKVEITGEAYFEIAKNKAMPFIVRAQDAEVQVLGTHFNVMAYTDEASLKTTLLEGSIKFIKNNVTNILKPGQQSQLLKTGQVKVVDGVDVNEVIAWKNGTFNFNGTDIGSVMRQLARWYDVDADFKGEVNELFYAEIPRDTKLSDVLKALELTGKVHFEINGRKIIGQP